MHSLRSKNPIQVMRDQKEQGAGRQISPPPNATALSLDTKGSRSAFQILNLCHSLRLFRTVPFALVVFRSLFDFRSVQIFVPTLRKILFRTEHSCVICGGQFVGRSCMHTS